MSQFEKGASFVRNGACYPTACIDHHGAAPAGGTWKQRIQCFGATKEEAEAFRDQLLAALQFQEESNPAQFRKAYLAANPLNDFEILAVSQAKAQWEKEGEIEFDDESLVCVCEDESEKPHGAYVQAWVWVDLEEDE